ncbi:toxin-antitoxin system YwqK family antitoxin [Aquimarina muelleri]|nr:hypothetical protein [Aquimarina muelleri]MCX2764126.1 hypothetical protein [Aquimarina muelleri]
MIHKIFILILLYPFMINQMISKKEYHYEYYVDGKLKGEGWKTEQVKIGFWHFYYPNGKVSHEGHYQNNKKNGYWYFYTEKNKLSKEGHFINDKAEKWWIIYDIATKITRKYQYKNNKKQGYCLLYKNNKLFKVELFVNDKKTGGWTDIISFKRDNPNASL